MQHDATYGYYAEHTKYCFRIYEAKEKYLLFALFNWKLKNRSHKILIHKAFSFSFYPDIFATKNW